MADEPKELSEFGMQRFDSVKDPSSLDMPDPSLMDYLQSMSSWAVPGIIGLGIVVFLFGLMTGRANWGLLGGIVAAGIVLTVFF